MFGQNFLKKAQEMQEKMARMQHELSETVVTGSSGGQRVTVTMNGKNEVLSVRIDPQLLKSEDSSMIEDLIVAATNDAVRNVQAAAARAMEEITGFSGGNPLGSLGIPGL